MKMASKALKCSVSSAPLVSSSSRSSSGVKALCFAPRSVSFPAKKISPLVNVIRAQKKEDSHTDDQDQRSSGQNQSDAAQGRPARESTRDIDLDDDSEFGELQSLVTKLMDIYQRKRSSDRNDSDFAELQSLVAQLTQLMDIYQGKRSSHQNDSEFGELQSLATKLMDIYQGMRSSDQNKRCPARESTRDIDLDDDSDFAELQSLMTELTDIDQGKRSSDQNQSAAGKRCSARESARDIDLDALESMVSPLVEMFGAQYVQKPWRYAMKGNKTVISCDMPGVDASELEVTIVGEELNIMFKGPKDKVDALGRKITGLYDTRIPWCPGDMREKVEAKFRNGTLYVIIPWMIDSTEPIYVPIRVVV